MQLHPSPVQLRHISEEMHQLFRLGMQQKGLSWDLDLDPALPRCVYLDGVRLRQIFLNLVGNALKFTETGSVTLSIQCQETADPGFVSLQISVTDTGIGIPQAEIKRIFEPFYQVERTSKRRFGGTGLGLSITFRLVELLGGELAVSSQLAQGTRFSFTLPRVEISDNPEPVDEQEALVDWLEEVAEKDPVGFDVPFGIRQPLLLQLQELQQNKSISKIQKYADQLVETGDQLNSQHLVNFGHQLKKAVQSFDIGQINALLDQLKQSLQT